MGICFAHKAEGKGMTKFVILGLILGVALSQDKGQKAYNDGKYHEARSYYEHVLKNREKDDAAHFGLGATAYQQQDMETAARSLNSIMNSEDKSLASKAMFNLGNMFRDQQKMEESLALYRKAIELDPTDEDAKVNYEMLKQVVQQQQDQDSEQGQDQDSDSDKNQDQDSEQGQDQDSDSDKNQDQDSDQNQEQQQNQESQAEQEKQDQEQKQSQAKQEESKEEKTDKQMQAEAILNALKDQEKINQKRQIAKAKSRKLEKDW
jgi:tetratricopeptide (TPR) repeat protein